MLQYLVCTHSAKYNFVTYILAVFGLWALYILLCSCHLITLKVDDLLCCLLSLITSPYGVKRTQTNLLL